MSSFSTGRCGVFLRTILILIFTALVLLAGCARHEIGRYSGYHRLPVRQHTTRVRNPIVTSADYWIQEEVAEEDFPGPTPEDLKPPEGDYIVGAGDRLAVDIFELMIPNTPAVFDVRVSEMGQITLPYLGNVKVAGLTTRGIEEKLADLLEPDYLRDPQVSVAVMEYRNRMVTLFNGIMRPGVYPLMRHDTTLLEMLASAGGILQAAEPHGYVIRLYKPEEADLLMLETGRKPPEEAPAEKAPEEKQPTEAAPAPEEVPAPGQEEPAEEKPGEAPPLKEGAVEEVPEAPGGALEPMKQEIEELKALAEGEQAKEEKVPTEPRPKPPAKPEVKKEEPEIKAEDLSRWMWVNGKWVEVPAPPEAPEKPEVVEPKLVEEAPPAPPESEIERKLRRLGVITGGVELKRIIRIDLDALQAGDPTQNIVLRNGDIVNIPMPIAGEFYMDGHVARRGVYSLTGRKITVLQAIAAAGGLDQVAVPSRTELLRRISDDEEEIIYLDIQKIARGEAPDIYLQPDDLLRVGTDQRAIFDAVIRNAFRATYGTGFVYDINFEDYFPWIATPSPLF